MSAISVRWLNVSWSAVHFETNYGLMQHSYIEIKNKLLRALDSEYNVVDMAAVFEVVAVLEKTPITPEILETTRLGKVINECRRRTNNEVLAKRAKHLVRSWRNLMIALTSDKQAPIINNTSEKSASIINNLSPLPTKPSACTATASTSSSVSQLQHLPASPLPQQNGTIRCPSALLKSDIKAASSSSPILNADLKDKRSDPESRIEREIADILSKLPPVNVNEIRWDSPEPTPVPGSPKPITDDDVDRYLNQQWEGVNGCVTHELPRNEQDTGFREWNEMVARRTIDDVLINILPYSIVD